MDGWCVVRVNEGGEVRGGKGGMYVVEMRMARVTWRNDHIKWMRHIHKHVHYTMKMSVAFQQTPNLH